MAPSTHSNRKGSGSALKRGWNSKPAGIAAIVVVALAVLMVVLSTLLGVFAPANKGQGSTPHSVATSSTSAAANGPCNVKVTDSSSDPKVPADLSWKTGRAGLTWPVSKSVGPTKTVDGFDACFARSPIGAALAAATATYSQYDPAHTVSEIGFYIADSAGKAADIAGTVKQYDPEATRASGINPAGFTVDSFTKNEAQVTLVYSYPQSATGYFGIPCTMVWRGDDWKLSVLDNGELFSGEPTTPGQGDFIPWGGGSK
jgi:hypothetical protein